MFSLRFSFLFLSLFSLVIFFFLVPTFHGKCVHNIRPTSGIGNLNIYPGEAFLEFLLPFSFFGFLATLFYFTHTYTKGSSLLS